MIKRKIKTFLLAITILVFISAVTIQLRTKEYLPGKYKLTEQEQKTIESHLKNKCAETTELKDMFLNFIPYSLNSYRENNLTEGLSISSLIIFNSENKVLYRVYTIFNELDKKKCLSRLY